MERIIENLYIWQESRCVVREVYKLMENCNDFGFKDQIQRASVSIMNNIAEGAESGTDARFISFLKISKGSCSEVNSMLYLCEDFKYCTSEKRIEIQKKIKAIATGLSNMIKKLSK